MRYGPKPKWRDRIREFFQKLWWRVTGYFANKQIQEGGSKRSEAEEQLARILYCTGIRPDAVTATTLRGGPCFLIKHQDAQEAFIHNSYKEAADKAIEWLQAQGDEIKPQRLDRAPLMTRKQRRNFDRRRRQDRAAPEKRTMKRRKRGRNRG